MICGPFCAGCGNKIFGCTSFLNRSEVWLPKGLRFEQRADDQPALACKRKKCCRQLDAGTTALLLRVNEASRQKATLEVGPVCLDCALPHMQHKAASDRSVASSDTCQGVITSVLSPCGMNGEANSDTCQGVITPVLSPCGMNGNSSLAHNEVLPTPPVPTIEPGELSKGSSPVGTTMEKQPIMEKQELQVMAEQPTVGVVECVPLQRSVPMKGGSEASIPDVMVITSPHVASTRLGSFNGPCDSCKGQECDAVPQSTCSECRTPLHGHGQQHLGCAIPSVGDLTGLGGGGEVRQCSSHSRVAPAPHWF